MPPCQTARISRRVRGEEGRLVEQHVAEPAAEDDAEDHPGQQVVGPAPARIGAAPAPERRPAAEPGDVAPAEQQPGDIGERVPADRELEPEQVEARRAPGRCPGRAGRRACRLQLGAALHRGAGRRMSSAPPAGSRLAAACAAITRARTRRGGTAMEYRYLGRSGLRVSVLTMGTMTFGGAGGFKAIGRQRPRRGAASRSTSASTPAST